MPSQLTLPCAALTLLLAACAEKPAAPAQAAEPATSTDKPAFALRAMGTEPGWHAEVGSGAQPRISLQLDYGERKLEVAKAGFNEEDNRYAGTADDGTPVTLSYRREQCGDGMSDRDYPASVSLQVGDKQYFGCAEFPKP